MRGYVKGLVLLSLSIFLITPAHGLVIGSVIAVSAVKLLAASLSFLAVPLAGTAHYIIKGSLIKKTLFLLISLLVIGILAYILINKNFIVEEKISYFDRQENNMVYESSRKDVKGIDSNFMPSYSRANIAPNFIIIFYLISSTVITITTTFISLIIVVLLKKIFSKRVQYKPLFFKVFFISMFMGGILGLLSTTYLFS